MDKIMINDMDVFLMVRRINRNCKLYGINYVKDELNKTFDKQIGAIQEFHSGIIKFPKNDTEYYEEHEFDMGAGERIKGWRRKTIKNPYDTQLIFQSFKFMLQNLEDYYNAPFKCKFNPIAKKIVDEWIIEKEEQLSNQSSTVNELTLESFFVKEPEKCIAFIKRELDTYKKPQGKLLAIILIGFKKLGYMIHLESVSEELHKVLADQFKDKIGTRQSISNYFTPYYKNDSLSEKQLQEGLVEEMILKIQDFLVA